MGAVIMIVGVAAMIIIHEGGHFIAAKAFGMKATEAFFGFGPKLWSTTRGETEYGIKGIPFGGYVRIIGMNPFEEVAPEDEGRTYRVAPYWKKTVVVLAGIFSHFVVAILLLWAVGVMYGTIVTDARDRVVSTTEVAGVSELVPDRSGPSPAAESGILIGDVIVSTDGEPVATWKDFGDFAETHGGQEVAIGIDRDGTPMMLTSTLVVVDKTLFDERGDVVKDEDGDAVTYEAGFFGVVPTALREDQTVISMIPVAFGQFGEAVAASITGLWKMITGFPELIASLFGGSEEVLTEVRPISPIGLVQLAGPMEQTLTLLALVNIFVGVLNFVPLYPLDGGHFAVATYEKVTGREPNVQKLLPVAAVVLLFLVSIGLIGIFLDIFKPI